MSDECITPAALCAERNCSRSKVALLGQPDKTFRIAGSGGKSGSLFAMSRVIAIEQEHQPCKSENRRRASLSVAQTKYAEMIEWVQSLEIKFSVSPTITLSSLAKQAIGNGNPVMPGSKMGLGLSIQTVARQTNTYNVGWSTVLDTFAPITTLS